MGKIRRKIKQVMGKYMRKTRKAGEVGLLEASNTQSSIGMRTRAMTSAQKRSSADAKDGKGRYYSQQRGGRLEKLSPVVFKGKRQRQLQKDSNFQRKKTVNLKQQSRRRSSRLKVKSSEEKKEVEGKGCLGGEKKMNEEILQGNGNEENKRSNNSVGADLGAEEASFGENVLEFEGRERESTPCSLMRDPDTIRTPGSSTGPAIATDVNSRENSLHRHMPTAHEMDDFFASAEEEQQKQFVEKYNFDPVNDKPLPGRYEWEKLNQP